MQIVAVNSPGTIRQFHQVPGSIYRDDPDFIEPLHSVIERIFDPRHNLYFNEGNAARFLLKKKDKVIGRIAAFYRNRNLSGEIRNGGIGFFECADDVQAAELLFNAAENWLAEKGCNVVDGPVNFGERDRWWGLLVDGFYPPQFGMNYNKPFYQNLFEANGYKNYFEQYTFLLQRDHELPAVIKNIKERLERNGHAEFLSPTKQNLKVFATDFVSIYNRSWEKHAGVQPMTEEQSLQLLKEIEPVMDPELFIFAYVNGKPAGFFIAIPDINKLLRFAKGKLDLKGKLNILLRKPFIKLTDACGIIFGVVPEYNNIGIEGGLVARMQEIIVSGRYYDRIELLWIGDFNKKMLNFVNHIQAKKYRTFITYRKILDESIPFERSPGI